MWVLTEYGSLVNLDACSVIQVRETTNTVVASEVGPQDVSLRLCACVNEEHGKAIIRSLVMHIHLGQKVANMRLIADENREVVS